MKNPIPELDDYQQFVGREAVQRVRHKARRLQDVHVAHLNSTYYGGGVAELLGALTLLMNSAGVKTGWRVIQGSPDYFSVTKKLHNALQGDEINLTRLKKQIYENVVHENAVRNHLDHDRVIIHDPQPLPIISHYEKRGPWIWRCHLDLTNRNQEVWDYLQEFVHEYDAMIVSLDEYHQDVGLPQLTFMPAINPFSIKNRRLSEEDMNDRLNYYEIPQDLPIVTQISRFDRWKDREGVIEAFKIAQGEIDATLVLLGSIATDDPEGQQMYQSLLDSQEERVIILAKEDTALVNALQTKSAVVLQKSIREGFGLTVTEAMWKGTPVIGGDVGGIKHQIEDGSNGFLVSSVPEAADKIVELVNDPEMRQEMGHRARQSVKDNYLLIRLMEQHLDLLDSFETTYTYQDGHG